ncbi:hypothetical protein [Bdellovibrio sp. HCB209]|uniref:hypothetical protein n=1 Tax=Bdellovibrio sp. HCB209 TaxID=3394354 RepID=UPI0039B5BBE1
MADILYIVLFIIGVLIIYFRPVARLLGVSANWEIGAGSLCIVIFAIHIMNTYVVQREIEEGLSQQPCGTSSPQGICYNLDKEVCLSAWNGADRACREEAEPILKERPGALIGPIVNRCKARRMDKPLRYNRIKEDNPLCKAYFQYIDDKTK